MFLMTYTEGQAIFGRITYSDGSMPEYNRPYLIVAVEKNSVDVVSVSSTKGKEWKLMFADNSVIHDYNPPFYKSSFVKLNSVSKIPKSQLKNFFLMDEGKSLSRSEMKRIKRKIEVRNAGVQKKAGKDIGFSGGVDGYARLRLKEKSAGIGNEKERSPERG